jgi:hypothetical protein
MGASNGPPKPPTLRAPGNPEALLECAVTWGAWNGPPKSPLAARDAPAEPWRPSNTPMRS